MVPIGSGSDGQGSHFGERARTTGSAFHFVQTERAGHANLGCGGRFRGWLFRSRFRVGGKLDIGAVASIQGAADGMFVRGRNAS